MDKLAYINIAIPTFCLQIFFVLFLFCFRAERRPHFWIRIILPLCGCVAFFFCVPKIPFGFLNLSFILIFLADSLMMWRCFRIRWKKILFYDIIAGTLQNIVAKTVTFFSILGWVKERTIEQLLLSNLLFLATAAFFYIVFIRRTNDDPDFNVPTVKFTVLFVVSVLVVFLFSPFADWFFGGGYARMFLCVNFITIDLVVLFVAFGIFEKNHLENEKEIIGRLLQLQGGQMQQTEESIEQINRKCHDMLRTIEMLEAGGVSAEKKHYMSELKDTVRNYDAACKTENRALDVLLTKYSLVCEEKKIQFTYMADGAALSFMEDCDLYSLLGNALENAVESLLQEPDESKRILDVVCKRRDSFVVIEVENAFSGELVIAGGIPATTKENDGYHGYGIKSMRYVTEKYGGNLFVGKEGNSFVVRTVFCR